MLGSVVAERFEIVHVAGQGAMGQVFRAHDLAGGPDVALKLMHPHMGDRTGTLRFEREALAVSAVRHPGVIRYVAHGATEEGRLFFAMEWIEGASLAERLKEGGLTIGEGLALARSIAEALAAVHAAGVVHRDLKPGNVMLLGGDAASPVLVDFGIARLRGADALTGTGALIGTPGYMSPEQARGLGGVDARTDVYALASLLYRVWAGRTPFEAEDVVGLLLKVVLDTPPRLSTLRDDVPPALDLLLARMLAKAPEDRPADGAALVRELGALALPVASARGPASRPSPGLSELERRVLCLVLAKSSGPGDRLRVLAGGITRRGGTLDVLADGSLLVTFAADLEAEAQADHAAMTALEIAPLAPDAAVAVAAGSTVVDGRLPVGAVIDRAVALLGGGPGVHLDDTAAGLIDERFALVAEGSAHRLVRLRSPAEVAPPRTLLGKRTPFVGRELELAQLESLFASSVEEPCARAALITSAAGVGKTRLLRELMDRLAGASPRPLRLFARGDALTRGAPFGLVAQLVRAAAGLSPGDVPALGQRKLAAHLTGLAAPDAARVAAFLGELCGAACAEAEAPASLREARRSPQLKGDLMARAFDDWLAAEAARAPVVIAIDELEHGDRPSLELLDGALRALAGAPLYVLAAGRSEALDRFPKLWSERAPTHLRPRPLSKRAALAIARHALGDGADATHLERLALRSEGNAFFLEELVRSAGAGEPGTLPETVLAVVQSRLATLDAEARHVLRAASVFGDGCDRDGLRALLDEALVPSGLEPALDALAQAELLERRGRAFGFRAALVREAAYAMLTERDRAVGHRLAAEHLAGTGAVDPLRLAEHWERGGDPARAVDAYLRAAEQALEGQDLAAARERAARGLACGAAGTTAGELRVVQAEAELWAAENAAAKATALDALDALPAGSARWCDAVGIAGVAAGRVGELGELERLGRLLERAQADVPPEAAPAFFGAIGAHVRQLLFAGAHTRAAALFAHVERNVDVDVALGPDLRGRLESVRVVRDSLAGDLSACLAHARAAVALHEEAGNTRAACMARTWVAYALIELGAHDEASGVLDEALAGASRLGATIATAAAESNLGNLRLRQGRLGESLAASQRAADAFAQNGDRRMESRCRLYLARAHAAGGAFEAAEHEALAALEVAGTAPDRAFAWAVLAEVALGAGDPIGATEKIRAALDLLRGLGALEEGESLLRLLHAEALIASGDSDRGRSAIRDARARLEGRAAKIGDPAWRARFLRDVPENARTLERAREWSA